jgi:hypothetical protein
VISAQMGRVMLNFSPGAVSEDLDIRVSPLANVGVPGVITPTTFDFGPDGASFSAPVTLTLSYDEADGSVAIDDQGRIVVAGSSRVGDRLTGDRFGCVARLLP